MGWIELEESQVAPHNMSETIADCISSLAQQRKDLWNTADTWGEVHDIHKASKKKKLRKIFDLLLLNRRKGSRNLLFNLSSAVHIHVTHIFILIYYCYYYYYYYYYYFNCL